MTIHNPHTIRRIIVDTMNEIAGYPGNRLGKLAPLILSLGSSTGGMVIKIVGNKDSDGVVDGDADGVVDGDADGDGESGSDNENCAIVSRLPTSPAAASVRFKEKGAVPFKSRAVDTSVIAARNRRSTADLVVCKENSVLP